MSGVLKKDDNGYPVMGGVSSTDSSVVINATINPVTGRLRTDNAAGSGTVTDVSVVSANGFAGSVANSTTTPAITLTTTVTGILSGNGTAISAASTTGSGSVVLATSPTLVTPVIGAATGTSLSVSGVLATATAVTLEETGAGSDIITLQAPAAIAASYTLTLPVDDGASGEFLQTNGSGVLSWAAGSSGITVGTTTITSGTDTRILYDNAGVLGEYTLTGTGTVVVMATSPTLVTPNIGVATATSVNGLTITASTGTLTITNGKTVSVSNTLTFTGTDTASVAFGGGGTVLYTTSTIPLTVGATTIASGTTTRILYDNAGVLGEYTLTGSGTVVAMATAPTFVTSITTPSVLATANDSGAIGASGTAFSDLFLASGALIDFAAGNSVITHSAAVLTVSTGDLRVTTAGTNTASVVTVGGTQTLTSKTLTSPTITTASLSGTQTLGENASIALDPAGSADGKYSGITIAGTAGATLAFGDLVYLSSVDSRWKLADADAASTSDRMMGMCVLAAAADGDPTVLLLMGQIRADAAFPALTIGSAVYVGETAGDIQVAIPTGADNVIRRVGYALTADEIYFNPSMDSQITVA